MTSQGQKVTNDPEGLNNPVYEGGFVTSDSLAAESLNDGGDYAEGNPHSAASKQPSKSSNLGTTDTSAAEELAPTRSGGGRRNEESAEEVFDSGRIDNYSHKPVGEETEFRRDGGSSGTGENTSGYDEGTLDSTKGTRSTTLNDSGYDESSSTTRSQPAISRSTQDGSMGYDDSTLSSTKGTRSETLRDNEGFGEGQIGGDRDTRSKAEIIEERRTNLPLPDDPPVASDWTSLDARNVNV